MTEATSYASFDPSDLSTRLRLTRSAVDAEMPQLATFTNARVLRSPVAPSTALQPRCTGHFHMRRK